MYHTYLMYHYTKFIQDVSKWFSICITPTPTSLYSEHIRCYIENRDILYEYKAPMRYTVEPQRTRRRFAEYFWNTLYEISTIGQMMLNFLKKRRQEQKLTQELIGTSYIHVSYGLVFAFFNKFYIMCWKESFQIYLNSIKTRFPFEYCVVVSGILIPAYFVLLQIVWKIVFFSISCAMFLCRTKISKCSYQENINHL